MTRELPYDMGNAGDLLKHGVLAEFVRWRCASLNPDTPFRFLDPFGGLPWEENVKPQIMERVQKLDGFALRESQPEIEQRRYYGSGHVVCFAAEKMAKKAEVLTSDRCSESCDKLCDSGLALLCADGFDSANAYSVLNADINGDLLLIDPFANFLPRKAETIMPKIAEVSESKQMAIVLFVLNLDANNYVGKKYNALKQEHLSDAWSLHCPKSADKSKYDVEVLLILPSSLKSSAMNLHTQLNHYAEMLSHVLGAKILFIPEKFP